MTRFKKMIIPLVSALLCSCAMSKAIYLGKDIYSRKAGPQSLDTAYSTEDINGVFPEAVYIKTRTQTFNAYHYYILNDGLIWYKSIDGAKGAPAGWTLFDKTGLPHNAWKAGFHKPERIAEISADADELVALSDGGGFYRYCFDKVIARVSGVWFDRQGWPGEEQLFLDTDTAKNLGWALGKRNSHVLYYEDRFGNQHHNGTMEIATTYVLLEDGQEIRYADTGLPPDFSRNYIGPERGAFKARALSASASTMFVINEAGEMYTRLADFDTVGCDPMWFKYTYIPYKSDLAGTNYFSNLNEWGLPAEDWRSQPPIPLAGKAAISRHITILQNGRGNGARELRVAGLNEAGETGYWTKAIFADNWEFMPVPLFFGEGAMLKDAKQSGSRGERGPAPDTSYSGGLWHDGIRETGWEYAIPNFNILEGDCDLNITWRGETCVLKLYPVEMWSYLKRDYMPGRTGSPKIFMATLEIPETAFDGLSAEFVTRLTQKYAKRNRKLFQYTIAASRDHIFLRDTDDDGSTLFLTRGTVPDEYSEFRQLSLIENFEEIARYFSPELTIDGVDALTYGKLLQKIELNKRFRDELRYKIRELKWSQVTAFKINYNYIPAHYIALVTNLRFVEVPKIRTITRFGERIVLENSAYVYTVSNIRIWAYQRIIALLETRLRFYNDLAKEFAGEFLRPDSKAAETKTVPWYAESIADYWDIAGLPHVIRGNFFSLGHGTTRTQKQAVLSFVRPAEDKGLFGWYLSIGTDGAADASARTGGSVCLFIDPLESARTIYSRKGKTPSEKKLKLYCVLYIRSENNPPGAQEIIDHALKPLIHETKQGIEARIVFDGDVFEIQCRYDFDSGGDSVIFRGF